MVIFRIYAHERRTRITKEREKKREITLYGTTGTLAISDLETQL